MTSEEKINRKKIFVIMSTNSGPGHGSTNTEEPVRKQEALRKNLYAGSCTQESVRRKLYVGSCRIRDVN